MTSAWMLRPYERETDEGMVLATWVASIARSRYGRSIGDKRIIWATHRTGILRAMAEASITVACDSGDPSVIWGWIAAGPGVVHYVFVAAEVVRAGVGHEVAMALILPYAGEMTGYTMEQVELRRLKALPPQWYPDFTYWLRSMN